MPVAQFAIERTKTLLIDLHGWLEGGKQLHEGSQLATELLRPLFMARIIKSKVETFSVQLTRNQN